MLKTLIKKELLQLNQFYVFNRKTKQLKTKKKIIGTVILYLFLFLIIGFSLGAMDLLFADTFISIERDWVYFSLTGLIAIVLGVFGDVFNTYALLYKAKDNDLLLSMPIPPSKLLCAKILGVYLMGLLYESIAFIPAIVVYWIFKPASFATIICPIIVWIVIGFFVAVLTCALGWVVAIISSKLKNRNFTKVLATLAFLALYYIVYFKAIGNLNNIALFTDQITDAISGWFFLAYHMGLAASGSLGSLAIYIAIVGALFALTYFLMTKSYIKLVTTNKGDKKVEYYKKTIAKKSVSKALLWKELKHFSSSSTYMLNSGLGLIISLGLAVFALIKMDAIRQLLPLIEVFSEELPWVAQAVPVAALLAVMFIICMNAISAPSVSLEGKDLWILQSSPVSGMMVMNAKIKNHFLLCFIPTLALSAVVAFILQLGWLNGILCVLGCISYMLFVDVLGLLLDFVKGNLNWTNEVYPIKQGFSVTVIILGGWGLAIVTAGLFYLIRNFVTGTGFLVGFVVIMLGASYYLYKILEKKTDAEFAYLG